MEHVLAAIGLTSLIGVGVFGIIKVITAYGYVSTELKSFKYDFGVVDTNIHSIRGEISSLFSRVNSIAQYNDEGVLNKISDNHYQTLDMVANICKRLEALEKKAKK